MESETRGAILVTGGAGFVGGHLRAAIERGNQPGRWIFTDRALPVSAGTRHRSAFIACDLGDLRTVETLLSETTPATILHLAGSTRIGATAELRDTLFRSNLMTTCNLLEVIRRRRDRNTKAPHFVLASTGLIYGDQPGPFTETLDLLPPNDYSLTKFLAEQTVHVFAKQTAVRACILRTALLYGPGQVGEMFIPSLIAAVQAGRRFPMTAGAQRRDFVFIADMVAALLLAVETELEGIYNIGSSRAVAMREVGEAVAALFDRRDLLGIGDLPYREREVWDYTLDSARLRTKGWAPRTGLDEGLRRTIYGDKP